MNIKYSLKKFDEISAEELKILSKLSFKQNYGILKEVNIYNSYKKSGNKHYCASWSAVIAKKDGEPIAWSLVRKTKRLSYIMLYVKPSFRRLGIGSKLFKKSKIFLDKSAVIFPHDYKSNKFFSKLTKPNGRKPTFHGWSISL